MAESHQDEETSLLSVCPICIETFSSPRSVPCKHSFCEQCLLTYITTLKEKGELGSTFPCPVCRRDLQAPNDEHMSMTWVQKTFPLNKELVNVILDKQPSKADISKDTPICLCNLCLLENEENQAVKFCINCCGYVCKNCVDAHKRFGPLKGHRLTEIGKLKKDDISKILAMDTKCEKHEDRDVEIYCCMHNIYCCVTCATVSHRNCEELLEISEMETKATDALHRFKHNYALGEKCIEEMIVTKEHEFENLSKQMQSMTEKMEDERNNIVKVLDSILGRVNSQTKLVLASAEAQVRLDIERLQNMKQDCYQGRADIDILSGYCLPVQKVVKQKSMSDKYFKTEKEIIAEQEIFTSMKLKWEGICDLQNIQKDIGKIILHKLEFVKNLSGLDSFEKSVNLLKYSMLVEKEEVKISPLDISYAEFTGITKYDSTHFVLCDNSNSYGYLCLYDNVSNSVSKLKMNQPFGIAVMKNKTMAISLPNNKTIAIISNREDELLYQFSYDFKDRKPYSITSLENGQLGITFESPPSFGIIDLNNGQIKFTKYFTHDSKGRSFRSFQYVAVDELRSHIIQPCRMNNAVYCFDYSSNPVFEYRDDRLRAPQGVGIDRNGNIYVCSQGTGTLHVLSPSGHKIQIVREVPKGLQAICFNEAGDRFWLTAVTSHSSRKCLKVTSFSLVQKKYNGEIQVGLLT